MQGNWESLWLLVKEGQSYWALCRWSFGILMYELLYGFTPFKGPKRDTTFENILKKPLQFPPKPVISPACQVRSSSASTLTCFARDGVAQASLLPPSTGPHLAAAGAGRQEAAGVCGWGRRHQGSPFLPGHQLGSFAEHCPSSGATGNGGAAPSRVCTGPF